MDANFKNRVEALLKAKGMTQRQLAERLGVSEVTVSRWMTDGANGRNPSVQTLQKIANILETTPDYLLGKDETMQQQETSSAGSVLGGLVLTAGVVIAAVALAKAAGLLGEKDKEEIEKILNQGGN